MVGGAELQSHATKTREHLDFAPEHVEAKETCVDYL